MRRIDRDEQEIGVFLPLFAIIIVVLLMFFGFLAFVGSATGGKAQLTNVTNLAALAALRGYIERDTGDDLDNGYLLRAQEAQLRGQELLDQNVPTLKFMTGDFGELQFASANQPPPASGGSYLTLGKWCFEAPQDPASDCAGCDAYPCFKANPDVPSSGMREGADAVRLRVCNPEAEPFRVPFVSSPKTLCAEAIATVVQRCVTFLVDLTYSTTFDTHYSELPKVDADTKDLLYFPAAELAVAENTGSPAPAPFDIAPQATPPPDAVPRIVYPLLNPALPYHPTTNPGLSALPFYDQAAYLTAAECQNPDSFRGAGLTFEARMQRIFWCSMPSERVFANQNQRLHYRSDYERRLTREPGGQTSVIYADVWFEGYDNYYAPQPFGAMFGAMNAALRAMSERTTGADRVLMLLFNRNIVAREPLAGMASDLGYMTQLTNLDNRGLKKSDGTRTGEIQPNFITRGWFPRFRPGSQSTNLGLALDTAINVMGRECPAASDKSILLFTDGLVNCSRWTGSSFNNSPPIQQLVYSPYQYSCAVDSMFNQNLYNHFAAFESHLKGSPFGAQQANGVNSYLWRMKQAGIKLTTVLAGDMVVPNTREYVTSDQHGYRSLTQEEMAARGWGGVYDGWNGDHRIGDYYARYPEASPRYGMDPGRWALANIPRVGYYYGYPNVLLAGPSIESGGIYCPLRPRCKSHADSSSTVFDRTPVNCGSPYQEDPRADDPANSARVLRPECLINAQGLAAAGAACRDDPGYQVNPSCSSRLTCSMYDLSKSEQAAQCAVKAVGGNPYILVAERRSP